MRSGERSLGLRGAAIAGWLFTWVGFLGCGAASGAPPLSLSTRPIQPDRKMAAMIGQQALAEYGYEEIIGRAVKANFLRYPDPEELSGDNFVGQTWEEAGRQAWPVFTQYAVWAGITSQLDSPAPGPADVVAIGELVVGLIHAGVIAAMVLTISSDSATTTTTTTATRSRRNYSCTARCQTNGAKEGADYVTGVSSENCTAATKNAKAAVPRGQYPRHCSCSDTEGFRGTGTECESHRR